jgi:hypothetical protein
VSRREALILLAVVTASLIARCLCAFGTDIFQDEAIYWWQSCEGLSFAPQPPVVSVLARLGLALGGHTVAALRLGALLTGTAGILAAWLLGRELAGPRAGLWSAGLFAVCPMFLTAGAVLTPDAPLFLCWLLFLWAAWRGARTGRLAWWLLAGVLFAAGVYTKYMMVLAGPALCLALLLSREGRAALRTPGPWLAGLVGAGLFLPVFLWWDHMHGWAALGYHLESRHHWGFESTLLRDYILGHGGAVSPVLMVALVWGLCRWVARWRRGDARAAWLVCFSVFPIAFFAVPSICTESFMLRVHWDAVGYASALVALGCLLGGEDLPEATGRRWRRVTGVGMALAGGLVALLMVVSLLPAVGLRMGLNRPPIRKLMGWRELAAEVRKREAAWSGPDRFLLTDSFSAALCIGFHLERREGIYCLPHPRNYRYGLRDALEDWGIDWQAMVREQRGRPALFVDRIHWSRRPGGRPPPPLVHAFFKVVSREAAVRLTRGEMHLGTAVLYHCEALSPSDRAIEWLRERSSPPQRGQTLAPDPYQSVTSDTL